MERASVWSGLLNPLRICVWHRLRAVSGSLFPFLHGCHPCCVLFSDGFCGALLIPNCAADFQRCPMSLLICRNGVDNFWIWLVVGSTKGNSMSKGSFNFASCFRTTWVVFPSFSFTMRKAQSESWDYHLLACLHYSSHLLIYVRSGNSAGKKRSCQQTAQTRQALRQVRCCAKHIDTSSIPLWSALYFMCFLLLWWCSNCFHGVAQKFQLDLTSEMQALGFRRYWWQIQGGRRQAAFGGSHPSVGTEGGSQGWCLLSLGSWATATLSVDKVHLDGLEHPLAEPALVSLEGVCKQQAWRAEGETYGVVLIS